MNLEVIMMIPTACFNASFRIWDCVLTLPLNCLKRRSLSEMIYAFVNFFFFSKQTNEIRLFIVIQASWLISPMYRWGREAWGMTQQLTTRISWISAWTSVRSTWLTFYSVLLLRSYCYEHVLWVSCLSLSWRKCVLFFFFSVCFSTFSFHDLKKKK